MQVWDGVGWRGMAWDMRVRGIRRADMARYCGIPCAQCLSAVSVVPAQGYLAYVCTSMPDTGSSVVGIPRGVLAVSGIFAP